MSEHNLQKLKYKKIILNMKKDCKVTITCDQEEDHLNSNTYHSDNTDHNNQIQLEKERLELKSKSMYLAKSAHEIKNIIIAISSLCNLEFQEEKEESSSDDEEGRKHKKGQKDKGGLLTSQTPNYIMALCNFGLSLIEDLNTFAKMERRDQCHNQCYTPSKGAPEEFNLIDALEFCLVIFKVRQLYDANKKQIKIKSNYDVSHFQKILMNETKLKQVVINLLSNAYKFTSSGEIELSCRNVAHDGENFVRIEVRDSGVGISDAEKAQLFNPFKMLERNQSLNSNGSGLGLYIVSEILSQYNSKLELISKPNKGSTFWFEVKDMITVNSQDKDLSHPSESVDSPIIEQNLIFTKSFQNLIFEINNGSRDSQKEPEEPANLEIETQRQVSLFTLDKSESNLCMGVIEEEQSPCSGSKKQFDLEKSLKSFEQAGKVAKKFSFNKLPKYTSDGYIYPSRSVKLNTTEKLSTDKRCLKKFYETKLDVQNYEEFNNDLTRSKIRSRSQGKQIVTLFKNKKSSMDASSDENHKKLRIIICDDEPISAVSAKNLFTKFINENQEKYLFEPEIYLMHNGIECLYKLFKFVISRNYIDVLLIDENMPFLNGSVISRLIKDMIVEKYMNDIVIYILSSNEEYDTRSVATGHIKKPLKKKHIAKIIEDNFPDYCKS